MGRRRKEADETETAAEFIPRCSRGRVPCDSFLGFFAGCQWSPNRNPRVAYASRNRGRFGPSLWTEEAQAQLSSPTTKCSRVQRSHPSLTLVSRLVLLPDRLRPAALAFDRPLPSRRPRDPPAARTPRARRCTTRRRSATSPSTSPLAASRSGSSTASECRTTGGSASPAFAPVSPPPSPPCRGTCTPRSSPSTPKVAELFPPSQRIVSVGISANSSCSYKPSRRTPLLPCLASMWNLILCL